MSERSTNIVRWTARTLAIITTCFFAVFILEGFGPVFDWQDSLMHALLTLLVLCGTILAWKRPSIGGWFFVVFGAYWLIELIPHPPNALLVGGIPLVTGILFLIHDGRKTTS